MNTEIEFDENYEFGLKQVWDDVANLSEVLTYPVTRFERALMISVAAQQSQNVSAFMRQALANHIETDNRTGFISHLRSERPPGFDYDEQFRLAEGQGSIDTHMAGERCQTIDIQLSKGMMREYNYLSNLYRYDGISSQFTLLDEATTTHFLDTAPPAYVHQNLWMRV